MILYIISGVCGMTGNELARQFLNKGNIVVGYDNFFASSQDTIVDLLPKEDFHFFEYDINNSAQMKNLEYFIKSNFSNIKINYINCAAVVHTEHFYKVHDTFQTNWV